ncbi:unnamed protein product [Lymnaea stagnalis]|uniref:Uncharacterized protein n=1 Tax=Lymnaea stagnalis TaxID=6523 RepID=A0AAV2GYM3_LYMST
MCGFSVNNSGGAQTVILINILSEMKTVLVFGTLSRLWKHYSLEPSIPKMSRRWGSSHALLMLTFLLMWSPSYLTDLPISVSMSDLKLCNKPSNKIHWLSEKTSALVTGKNSELTQSCHLRFGVASDKKEARIRLHFDFLYIEDCSIRLQINESLNSDFKSSLDNKEIFMSKCNTRNPGSLYTQPKNFILVSLINEQMSSQAVNFRLNVSMAENPPKSGLELHILIIVGFVVVIVVVMAGLLLFKYITRLSHSWHERRVEAAMARAINIFNSQEPLEEPDLVFIRPGEVHQRSSTSGAEIAFVHNDGRIERFRSRDVTASNEVLHAHHKQTSQSSQASHKRKGNISCNSPSLSPQSSHPKNNTPLCRTLLDSTQGLTTDQGDAVSLGGSDMPPSYEEALDMPGPSEINLSPVEDESELDDAMDVVDIPTSRLQLDYMNVGPGSHRDFTDTEHVEDPSNSNSEEALLPVNLHYKI